VQVEPAPQAVTQPPPEQSTVQFPPGGQEVLQWLPEQSTVHAPALHQVRQPPPEQAEVHWPVAAHCVSHAPPEQSAMQGFVEQTSEQWPPEQAQVPPSQGVEVNDPPPGKGTYGPPVGPVDGVPLQPMATTMTKKARCGGFMAASHGGSDSTFPQRCSCRRVCPNQFEVIFECGD
jgi:hypothetical protein